MVASLVSTLILAQGLIPPTSWWLEDIQHIKLVKEICKELEREETVNKCMRPPCDFS